MLPSRAEQSRHKVKAARKWLLVQLPTEGIIKGSILPEIILSFY
jgi:hypothetical protein